MFKYGKYLIAALVVLAVGLSVYAFAASNTVPDTIAGEGADAITAGYTASAITYTLGTTDAGTVSGVTFTLTGSPTPDQVKVRLVTTGTWSNACTITGAGPVSVTCTWAAAVNVEDIDEFRVVAVGQ